MDNIVYITNPITGRKVKLTSMTARQVIKMHQHGQVKLSEDDINIIKYHYGDEALIPKHKRSSKH